MRTQFACAAILACAACQQSPAPAPAVDAAAETKAIEAVESGQIAALGKSDLAGATGLYSDDAVFIGGDGKSIKGKDAIVASFEDFLKDPTRKLDYTAGPKTLSSSGDMAYSIAPFSESYTDPKTKKVVNVQGTNLSVWRRQDDGSWKLVADSNPSSEAAADGSETTGR